MNHKLLDLIAPITFGHQSIVRAAFNDYLSFNPLGIDETPLPTLPLSLLKCNYSCAPQYLGYKLAVEYDIELPDAIIVHTYPSFKPYVSGNMFMQAFFNNKHPCKIREIATSLDVAVIPGLCYDVNTFEPLLVVFVKPDEEPDTFSFILQISKTFLVNPKYKKLALVFNSKILPIFVTNNEPQVKNVQILIEDEIAPLGLQRKHNIEYTPFFTEEETTKLVATIKSSILTT